MFESIQVEAEFISEPLTKKVTLALLKKHEELIKRAPAAMKQHNAWIGGLTEHIWSMLQYATNLVNHYKENYNKSLSKDKVIFGIIAHDLGKIIEYTYDSAIGYAPRGVLTPHIVAGACWVYEEANKAWPTMGLMAPDEFARERDHLVHIVASHHGKGEWGSPVVPSTLEAVLVHQIDMIDSKFMHAMELVEGKAGPTPGFSEKSWSEKTQYLQYN